MPFEVNAGDGTGDAVESLIARRPIVHVTIKPVARPLQILEVQEFSVRKHELAIPVLRVLPKPWLCDALEDSIVLVCGSSTKSEEHIVDFEERNSESRLWMDVRAREKANG